MDLLIRLDKRNVFSFSPLQSDAAKTFLLTNVYLGANDKSQNTVVVVNEGNLTIKSDAVIEIMLALGGIFRASILLKLVPRVVRDYLYDFIATRRLEWFGQSGTCRIPSKSEASKFLE